jgi:hypothetical protein
MSTINSKNVQVGTSGVANQNFTLYQPNTPDGTVRLGVGNSGVTTSDVVTVTNAGNMTVSGVLTATTLSGAITGGAVTATSLAVSGATTTTSLAVNSNNISAVNSLGFRNRIINGDMRIDQRNAGASVATSTATTLVYTIDRFGYYVTATSKFTMQQNAGSVTPPTGFTNYLGMTSTSAYSVSSTDELGILQPIEGFNVADLGWGAAGAQSVTLSFWVRSSLTGTFGGTLRNASAARSYPFSFTISAANTWEQKTITIAGDTSGTWGTGNGVGIYVTFSMGAGSTKAGTAGSWQTANFISATGATNMVGTNGATFYITGVQLEAGSVATPFERRDYGRELVMCLRYYWRINTTGSAGQPIASGNAENTTRGYINLTLPQPMRTSPTCSVSSLSHLGLRGGGSNVAITAGSFVPAVSAAMATIIGGEFDVASSTSASTGGCVKMVWMGASGWIDASAEL